MKLNYKNLSAWMLGVFGCGLAFTACSDDLGMRTDTDNTPQGIVLMIPDVEAAAESFSTRATYDVDQNEGSINDLYLYIFKGDGANYSFYDCTKLTADATAAVNIANYKAYPLKLEPGNYKFYLLGNVESYAVNTDLTSLKSVDAIKGLQLTFTGELEANNLPMASLSRISTAENPSTDDAFVTISDGNSNLQIYADMQFLCSKVRYTAIFDNSLTGVSKDFGTNVVDFDPTVGLNNILNKVKVADAVATSQTTDFIQGKKSDLAKYENSDDKDLDFLASNKVNSFTSGKRAWQGVVYLPENTNAKKSQLVFNGKCVTSSGDNLFTINKTIDLLSKNVAGNGEYITRGNMYDIVISVKNYDALDVDFSNITPWNVKTLTYILNGKPYELIVEKTSVDVGTQEFTVFGYSSDVPVTLTSPVLKNSDLTSDTFSASAADKPLYTFEVNDKTISVRVNPTIPFNDLQKVETIKSKYQYFHVNAGQLRKRIDVADLDLEAFFQLEPQVITVDIRELLANGNNAPTFPLNYITNVDDATITMTNGTGTQASIVTSIVGSGIDNVLTLKYSNGGTITPSNMTKGSADLELTAKDILQGNTYWKSNHEYDFIFKCSAVSTTQPLKVIVKPYTADYVIHFKDETKGWGAPHIYIYQCLELPSDLTGTNSQYKGKTVGYEETYDDGSKDYYAALEYAFTNDLSFNGWSGYGGTVSTSTGAGYSNGFAHMGGVGSATSQTFKPAAGIESIYNYNAPHNETHKSNLQAKGWICLQCKDEQYKVNKGKRTWPGIVMEKEEDGWWKYTLTGVATPGKAMIMFSDGHVGEVGGSTYRYPDHAQVGVPLFDFPDNEGWLLYKGDVNGNYSFSDDKPSSQTGSYASYYNYRIYWPSGYEREWAYLAWGTRPVGGEDGWGRIGVMGDNWDYYDFGYRSHNDTFKYSLGKDNNSLTNRTDITGNLSTFQSNADGWYYAFFDSGRLQGGKPSGVSTGGGGTSTSYIIYFQDQNPDGNKGFGWSTAPYIYVWNDGSDSDIKAWPGERMTYISNPPAGVDLTDANNTKGRWFKYTMTAGHNRCKINTNGGTETGDITISATAKENVIWYNNGSYGPYTINNN